MQDKYTPLHRAAKYGNSETVQLLLTAKSNVNAGNCVSTSPSASIIIELCGAELCGLDWCSTSGPRYTKLLRRGTVMTVSQCSYYSLQRAMLMLRTLSVTPSCKYDGVVWC